MNWITLCVMGVGLAAGLTCPILAEEEHSFSNPKLESALSEMDDGTLWPNGLGNGFRKGARHAGIFGGAGFGTRTFGSRHRHDMAIGGIDYGVVFTELKAPGEWYQGNWELRGEFFGGAEFNPDSAYVVGGSPFLRYHFATGTPFIPFFEGGAGLTATGIRKDLSTIFEFNVQAGTGVQWFFQDDVAATLQYRWLHISNARIQKPNEGVNTSLFFIGVEWYF